LHMALDNNLIAPLAVGGILLIALILFRKKKGSSAVFLNRADEKLEVRLIDKVIVSHDTRRFRFALPSPNMTLGLPVGKCIAVYAPNKQGVKAGEWNGREDPDKKDQMERKYTPMSQTTDKGFFDLMLKVYKPNERFCDGGKMSQYLDTLTPGSDVLEMRGPFGTVEYKGQGRWEYLRKPLPFKKHIGMMAGGTGITPMLQVIHEVLRDQADTSVMSLLYANQTADDILLRPELEKLAKDHPHRFKLWYTVDRADAGWSYSTGFITTTMIEEHMPPPGEDTVILLCGPPPMVKFACQDNLNKLGYPKTQVLAF